MVEYVIILPLFVGLYTGIMSKYTSKNISAIITSTAIILSAIISAFLFYKVAYLGEVIHLKFWRWLSAGNLQIDTGMYIDKLSVIMLVVVTFISSAVHLYSAGYMYEDDNMQRFMSYISVFTAIMLILVTSDNFMQLFFGWEGVGACSYLLIGFWNKKDSANNAALKAFVVNRVADLALVVSIILIYHSFGTLEFASVFRNVGNIHYEQIHFCGYDIYLTELIAMLILIGCMGKSAQIGFHVWLPDAMEGPTPVSGLIHAATMVTAGVFLIVRCSFIFEYASVVREIIVVVGSLTALLTALIAITQNDIKKIIAYSTCSQLGYMFIACGLSQYHLAIFHLFTHAFFKAMLFLGAGSVIHAMHHEQDVNKMGGVASYMPLTHIFFWIGSLAIMGVYPFAGYYSKELIIESAYLNGGFAYYCSMLGVLCTSIYSIKIITKVFYGSKNWDSATHPHEASLVMNLPMAFLALGAVFSGVFGSKLVSLGMDKPEFYSGVIFFGAQVSHHKSLHDSHDLISSIVLYAPVIISCLGMILGYITYSYSQDKIIAKKGFGCFLYSIIKNKFYLDFIYQKCIVELNDFVAMLLKCFDKIIIDAAGPGLMSNIAVSVARIISFFHTGLLRLYASIFMAGIATSLSLILYFFVL